MTPRAEASAAHGPRTEFDQRPTKLKPRSHQGCFFLGTICYFAIIIVDLADDRILKTKEGARIGMGIKR